MSYGNNERSIRDREVASSNLVAPIFGRLAAKNRAGERSGVGAKVERVRSATVRAAVRSCLPEARRGCLRGGGVARDVPGELPASVRKRLCPSVSSLQPAQDLGEVRLIAELVLDQPTAQPGPAGEAGDVDLLALDGQEF
jgi:hypothetical protein